MRYAIRRYAGARDTPVRVTRWIGRGPYPSLGLRWALLRQQATLSAHLAEHNL